MLVNTLATCLSRLGRVKCYCGTFITGGICCGIVALLSFILSPGQSVWLPVTIAMIGKFLISQTFAIAYLYTAELFPTNVRNVAVGTASTFARIGSMSAPYIVDLLVCAQGPISVTLSLAYKRQGSLIFGQNWGQIHSYGISLVK